MYQIKTNLHHVHDTVCCTETFLLTIREIAGAPQAGNDIIVMCSLAGQRRNAESGLLGESGNQTPQTGSGHTWEYLNFDQNKSLECVRIEQVEEMGSDQE